MALTSLDGAGGSIEEGVGCDDLPESDERSATGRKVSQRSNKIEADSLHLGVYAKSSARAETAAAGET